MNARARSVILRTLAISMIALSLIITTTKGKEVGILEISLQILRTLGLCSLLISIVFVPLSLFGWNETVLQIRLQRVFLYVGAGIVLLALIIDTGTQFRRMQFWLYTGALFTIITTTLMDSVISSPDDSEEE